jgi:uncharacterized protein YuzE
VIRRAKHRRPPTLTIDPEAGCAYLMLSNSRVVRTFQYSDDIKLDLDRFGDVVGMEHTAVDATLPASEITKLFPTRGDLDDHLGSTEPARCPAP